MTHDLTTSLDDLAEAAYADAPASTIDIGKARADGRRRVLASRLAPLGGGVAVVAACALVVNGLGGTSAAKQAPQNSAASGHHDFTGTDPLTAIGAFGYLPDGFHVTSYTSGADYGSGVTAAPRQTQKATTPTTPPEFNLTSSPTEQKLPAYETKKEVAVPGSPEAYIISNPGDAPNIPADLSLAWETESGSWYYLGGDYQIHGDQLEALLIKVASSVTPDGSAVALPIHVEGLPKSVTLGEASLGNLTAVEAATDPDGVYAGLSYHTGTAGPGTGAYFDISVSPIASASGAAGTHNAGPNNPALKLKAGAPGVPGTTSACKDSEGLHICVDDNPNGGADALASVGGVNGLLSRITSLGTDPANWTTHVVN